MKSVEDGGEHEDCEIPTERNLCVCGSINKRLLVSKLFYFFFWSAYGSFFPLLGVYFKQIGMNPTQSGILVGCRPLIEFISAPSMGSLADRLHIRRLMLLFNLMCWMCFVFPFAFIKPADNTCHRYLMLSKNISEIMSQESSEVQELLKPNTANAPHIEPHRKGIIVFSEESIHQVFWLLLFLSLVGEFFSSPATTIADSVTLAYLGDSKEKYGRQRMFGSMGWGSAMFIVGFVIDIMPSYQVCGVTISKDYTYSFYFFLGYMVIAFIVATQFSFKEVDNEDPDLCGHPTDVVKIFLQPKYITVVFVAFYAGLGMGLARVFLFWHLEDLGAPPKLFGISSALDHISETVTYFFTENIIYHVGHIPVICFGLLANFIRFVCISYLINPWLILPLDVIQGFAHAGVWAALTSYMGRAAPRGYRSAVQGVLQGFYYGLGRAVGAIGGGVFTHTFGTDKTFRIYGCASLPVLVLLFAVVHVSVHKERRKADEEDVESGNEETEMDSPGETSEVPVFKRTHEISAISTSLDKTEDPKKSVEIPIPTGETKHNIPQL